MKTSEMDYRLWMLDVTYTEYKMDTLLTKLIKREGII